MKRTKGSVEESKAHEEPEIYMWTCIHVTGPRTTIVLSVVGQYQRKLASLKVEGNGGVLAQFIK